MSDDEKRRKKMIRNGVTRDRGIYRTMLREVSVTRTAGFTDACWDLGKHTWCGVEVPYSRAQVFNVLTGRSKSATLVRRIAERRPDLFTLRYVTEEVRALGRRYMDEMKAAGEAAAAH